MPQAFAQSDPQLLAWAVNQRFLNALATLDRLLHDDFGGFPDPSVHATVAVFSGHIQAFARIHRLLGDEPGEPAMDAGAHLAQLCQELCAAHLAPRGVHCEVRVEQVVLPREVCRNLGLIVVELVTDAAQHAFTGRTDGQVWVTLHQAEHGWICQVSDNGMARRAAASASQLVRGFAAALGAHVEIRYDLGGVTTTVSLSEPAAA
jgi:two-component sensor histidine kinase